jgi:hypothetical protein
MKFATVSQRNFKNSQPMFRFSQAGTKQTAQRHPARQDNQAEFTE